MFNPANAEHVQTVRRVISSPRLAPYDNAAGDDALRSLELYQWNMELSSACYGSLQTVEIALRNAIHDELTQHHHRRGLPRSWTDDPANELEPRLRSHLIQAKARLRAARKPITPDRVVSELTFGFWRFLLSARYEHSLWTPAIRNGFPCLQPLRRRELAEPVERLHRLRNRVAHHEPVHRRNLETDHDDMLKVMAAISPQVKGWAEDVSMIPRMMIRRPLFMIPGQRVRAT